MKNSEEILKTLLPYLLAYPQSKIKEEGLVIYAKALSDLTPSQVDAAMLKLLNTSTFFPSVAEIREQAENMSNFAQGKTLPTPDEAWAEVEHNARENFVYRPWTFSCEEVKLAAERYGIQSLCELKVDDVGTARAQFTRFYKSVCEQKRERKTNSAILAVLPASTVQELVGKLASAKAITA